MDTSLQRLAAISNHLICALAELVSCESAASKQGAFKCFASLGANDEDIRKRIIEIEGLMIQVVSGMTNTEPEVCKLFIKNVFHFFFCYCCLKLYLWYLVIISKNI